MIELISPSDLANLIRGRAPFALLDVREQGEYNEAHIPGSTSLPRRLLEFRIGRLVPYRGTQVVVCDDDGLRAPLAAETLLETGYSQVSVLEGGINAWASRDYPTEWGTNVPSKDFGEKVQVQEQVPEMRAEELHRRLQQGEKLVLVDARTPEEHEQYCIPGSRSVPGGELGLRIWDIVGNSNSPVVVHCAGRTRSIIGTSLLKRMGLPKVYGLRNGTMGWQMAGLELETGSQRLKLPKPSAGALARAEAFALRVAGEDGVVYVDIPGLRSLMRRATQESVYLIDVRTREEYVRGHIPGFWWYPGGQAVQQCDDIVAVRHGPIVFCCDGIVRASVTASWFRQMGFPSVYAAEGGVAAWSARGLPLERGMPSEQPIGLQAALAKVKLISPGALKEALVSSRETKVIFVDTSREFARSHVPGSRWIPRGWLELKIGEAAPRKGSPLVVTCSKGLASVLAGATLKRLGYRRDRCWRGARRHGRGQDSLSRPGSPG